MVVLLKGGSLDCTSELVDQFYVWVWRSKNIPISGVPMPYKRNQDQFKFILSMTDDKVRDTYICAVEAASHEDEAVTCPASLVLPFLPDKFVRGIRFSLDARHDGTNQYGHEHSADNMDYARFLDHRQRSIEEDNHAAGYPCHQKVADERMPCLRFVLRMEKTVHGDELEFSSESACIRRASVDL